MPASSDDKEKKEEKDHADTEPYRMLHDSEESGVPDLRILHFNDVYHPQEDDEEPKGGAARFKSLCDHYRNHSTFENAPRPLTLFSGDALNPSRESSVTKGSHMIPVLNELGIDAACVGNHEFDFGAAHFSYLAKDCNFPWLLANLFDPDMGEKEPLGHCKRTVMLETTNGIKVGLMGLVEKEWTEKINNSLPSDIEFYGMREVAKELAPQLRQQGADIVIALTHARQERDYHFCENIPAGLVDIVLAGHDHWVEHKKFDNGTVLLRSGFDFKNLTYTEGFLQKDGRWKFNIVRRNLTTDLEEDAEVKKHCEDIVTDVNRKMEWAIGMTAVPLEARKDKCQTQESNYGNFLTDLMRMYHSTDCALINGGTFFGDTIYQPGNLLVKDIVDCFPFEDPVVVVKVKGQAIRDALENGVSKYPEPDSRFPQVSNIVFSFDPKAECGQRVQKVSIAGQTLDLEKEYTVATRSLLVEGKAGYESLKGKSDGGVAEEVVDEENGILVTGMLRQYFTWKQVAEGFKGAWSKEQEMKSHRQSVTTGLDRHFSRYENEEEKIEMIRRKVIWKWRRLAGQDVDMEKLMEAGDGEFFVGWKSGIAPKIEGRILIQEAS